MNNILIVDPFSTGKMYAKSFSQLGYPCYAVLSSPDVPLFFQQSFEPTYFQNKKLLSIDEIKKQFSQGEVAAVVIGAETGVVTGEELAHYFNVEGNNIQNSLFRRDKFVMQQQLKLAQLAHIQSQMISSENKTVLFNSLSGYVLKPLNSAGTEDVYFCETKNELENKIAEIKWGAVNITGQRNDAFIVQEFIRGEEFVVDMIIAKQQIQIVSLCRYRKAKHNGSGFVYEHMEILDPNQYQFAPLLDYAKQCAKALGFTFGPVHMEIMCSAERMVMIEAGARLHGGIAPMIFQQCYQPDLLQQAVKAYLGKSIEQTTQQVKFARVVFMVNTKENAHFSHTQFTQQIAQLKSYSDCVCGTNNPLPLTIDLLTCPCLVALVAQTQAQIEQDEQQLREIFAQCCH